MYVCMYVYHPQKRHQRCMKHRRLLSIVIHCCPMLSLVIHSCPLLSIVVHCCPLLSIVFDCYPLLSIVIHCCPLLSIVIHCCPLLSIVVHCRYPLRISLDTDPAKPHISQKRVSCLLCWQAIIFGQHIIHCHVACQVLSTQARGNMFH